MGRPMRAAFAFRYLLSSAVALTVFSDVTGSWERDPGCQFPMSGDIAEQVERWHRVVQARDVDAIAAIYSPDAILMGIGEQSIRLGRREIASHYVDLLSDSVSVSTLSRVIEVSCSAAIVTGLQKVEFGEGPKAASVEAAYKMMYAFGDGAWMLIHHHLEPFAEFVRGAQVDRAEPSVGQSRVQTATLPERQVPLPAPPFQLPAPPPVFVPKSLPQILSSTRPADATEVTVPPLAVSIGAFPHIASAAAPEPIKIAVPVLKLDLGPFPVVATPAVAAPVSRPTDDALIAPRLSTEPKAIPAVVVARPTPPVISPLEARAVRQAKPVQDATPPPARAPSVASFAQRAATAAKPMPSPAPAPAARPAKLSIERAKPVRPQPVAKSAPSAAAAAVPTSGLYYRPVRRWDEKLPIFEQD